MANPFEVRTIIPFSFVPPALLPDNRKKMGDCLLLSHALISSAINMSQKVYRRISDNIYQSIQEHKEASLELEKIQFRKRGQLFFWKNEPEKNPGNPFLREHYSTGL